MTGTPLWTSAMEAWLRAMRELKIGESYSSDQITREEAREVAITLMPELIGRKFTTFRENGRQYMIRNM